MVIFIVLGAVLIVALVLTLMVGNALRPLNARSINLSESDVPDWHLLSDVRIGGERNLLGLESGSERLFRRPYPDPYITTEVTFSSRVYVYETVGYAVERYDRDVAGAKVGGQSFEDPSNPVIGTASAWFGFGFNGGSLIFIEGRVVVVVTSGMDSWGPTTRQNLFNWARIVEGRI